MKYGGYVTSIISIFLLQLSSVVSAASLTLPNSGQTVCTDSRGGVVACPASGQDASSRAGVAWPEPRFTDNNNGTVTDSLTGLVWLKNANCFGTVKWEAAVASSAMLKNGFCGLNDGSVAGTWRLPNRNELASLIDYSKSNPALPTGHQFSNLKLNHYWTSTTNVNTSTKAWYLDVASGVVNYGIKTSRGGYVLPVRTGAP